MVARDCGSPRCSARLLVVWHSEALLLSANCSYNLDTFFQVDFSPKDLAQVANFLAKENVAKQVGLATFNPALEDLFSLMWPAEGAVFCEQGGSRPPSACASPSQRLRPCPCRRPSSSMHAP